ncbi:MAG: hypothetical protein ACRC35_10385 [Angustibacter sp.]
MHYFAAALHTLGVQIRDTAVRKLIKDPERGSVTLQEIAWAVAALAIVGIAVAAIRSFVSEEAGKI